MHEQDYSDNNAVEDFFHVAQNDVRLSSTHICLYFVLFKCWLKNNRQNIFAITRRSIMELAKIKSTATYHKCISELYKYGYINYIPSYHPAIGTLVSLNLSVSNL